MLARYSSQGFLPAACHRLSEPIDYDGEKYDSQTRDEAVAGLVPLKRTVNIVAQSSGGNKACYCHHRQRHHCGLVDAGHYGGERHWNLDLGQDLAGRCAVGPGDFQGLWRHLAYAQIGEPDYRWDCVDYGGEYASGLAQAEKRMPGSR